MPYDKAVFNEAIYHGTQRVAIFSRSRNGFTCSLIMIIYPILIRIDCLYPIYIGILQGISVAVPILSNQPTKKWIGKLEVIKASVA